MKTTIFGVLLEATPEQDTMLAVSWANMALCSDLPFNAWWEDSETSAAWDGTVPVKRSCRCVTPKMRCKKRKTSFGPAIKPCKTT